MRPIKITMSAFGPYAGTTVVDMEKLGENGLYLITGDTGAGKTTIFDAICYALFGSPSGGNRDGNMLRSNYAEASTPTEVELIFTHQDKRYVVRRNPEYLRPKKGREDEFTTQKADATLELPDGSVITKINAVNEKVIDILGVTREQFSKIAMLAQGEFSKILFAETTERQAIFRKIFDTACYETLQKELYAQCSKIGSECSEAKRSVSQSVAGICCDEDDLLSFKVEKAKNDAMLIGDIVALLQELINNDQKKNEELEEKNKELKEKIRKVDESLGLANENEKKKIELAGLKTDYENAKAQQEPLKEKCLEAKNKQKETAVLIEKQTIIKADIPKYEVLDKLTVEIKHSEGIVERGKNNINRLLLSKQSKENTLTELKDELKEVRDSGEKLTDRKAKLEKAREVLDKLQALDSACKVLDKKIQEADKAQEIYNHFNNIAIKLGDEYSKQEIIFRNNIAGILAKGLSDGDRCPVCGSLSHPQRAKCIEQAPTQEQLDELKSQYEEADKKAMDCALTSQSKKSDVENAREKVKEDGKELLGSEFEDIEGETSKRIVVQKTRIKAEEDLIKIEEANLKRKEKLEKDIPELEEKIKELETEINSERERVAIAETAVKKDKEQFEKDKKSLVYESGDAAQTAINSIESEIKALNDAAEAAENNLKNVQDRISSLTASMKVLNEQIENLKKYDAEQLAKERDTLAMQQNQLEHDHSLVKNRILQNSKIKSDISRKSDELDELETKYQWVRALSETASGNISGKEKIQLETYIQATYFEKIINRANLRLLEMSNSQYELKRMETAPNKKSSSGLDLCVIDHYNGSERNVKTLSGGESFMAALALALGLSDEVQARAGGIRIDTLFVDEGFGSLDSEALDNAYRTLISLTEGNRLVGIISHVAELKEKIEKQIVVKKEKTGGSSLYINA